MQARVKRAPTLWKHSGKVKYDEMSLAPRVNKLTFCFIAFSFLSSREISRCLDKLSSDKTSLL